MIAVTTSAQVVGQFSYSFLDMIWRNIKLTGSLSLPVVCMPPHLVSSCSNKRQKEQNIQIVTASRPRAVLDLRTATPNKLTSKNDPKFTLSH